MRAGELLWTPGPDRIRRANVTALADWLARERGRQLADYRALWRWSVEDLEGFWQALWDYFGIESSAPHTRVLGRRSMPGAEWFPGARLNYAQHVLRRERAGGAVLLHLSETRPLSALPWTTLGNQVRTLATALRALGVQPGDRVVAWMPNIPETMAAMLATTAIGAIWACCSPDFGERGTLDRLAQLAPKVLFSVDGYRYGGKAFDRRSQLRDIAASLTSLEHLIYLPHLDPEDTTLPLPSARPWRTLLEGPVIAPGEFEYAQVPFDHPLWTLFSSGTTGLPKPIVHGHGGILLENLKNATFHFDLHPDDRVFFFTTSGWMLWNFITSTPLAGAVPVLYDGHPAYPAPDALWRMADEAGVASFGASPTYVEQLKRSGIVPRERYRLEKLRTINLAGSPATPESMAWFYDNVKADLWVANGSGGTDCCTGFVGGVPTLPVRAGEIQAPQLAVSAKAFNARGESVVDEVPSFPRCRTRSSSISICRAAVSSCRCSSSLPPVSSWMPPSKRRSATPCAVSTRHATCRTRSIRRRAFPTHSPARKWKCRCAAFSRGYRPRKPRTAAVSPILARWTSSSPTPRANRTTASDVTPALPQSLLFLTRSPPLVVPLACRLRVRRRRNPHPDLELAMRLDRGLTSSTALFAPDECQKIADLDVRIDDPE